MIPRLDSVRAALDLAPTLAPTKSEAPSTAGMEPQGIVEDAVARRRGM
jgi:hypothetical protein